MINKKLLMSLMDTYGISGDEGSVRLLIEKEMKRHVDDMKVDKMGNLICRKKGRGQRVMLAAHMDEIGLIVKFIDKDGRIFFSAVGGIEPLSVLGQRVSIKAKKANIHGVITTADMSSGEDIRTLPRIDEMYVDTGMKSEELKRHGVGIGTYISLDQHSGFLGNGKLVYGKALDDRAGCYVLIELAKRLERHEDDIYFVFTVQEEVGLYGAKTSTYQVDPSWAIAVDVTTSDEDRAQKTKFLGSGPCLTIKDADMISDHPINEWITSISKKNKIPLQLEVSDFGTTDALNISLSRGGVSSTVVTIPVKNLHSTIGIAHMDDIENVIKLLCLLLSSKRKITKK